MLSFAKLATWLKSAQNVVAEIPNPVCDSVFAVESAAGIDSGENVRKVLRKSSPVDDFFSFSEVPFSSRESHNETLSFSLFNGSSHLYFQCRGVKEVESNKTLSVTDWRID